MRHIVSILLENEAGALSRIRPTATALIAAAPMKTTASAGTVCRRLIKGNTTKR